MPPRGGALDGDETSSRCNPPAPGESANHARSIARSVAAKPCTIPLAGRPGRRDAARAEQIVGEFCLSRSASTSDVDLERVAFRRYAFCNPCLLIKNYARPPLLYKHDEAQVAGEIDSLTYDELGNLKIRATVTHEQAKRCGAFSIRAKISAYRLCETETRNFHAVVTDAEIVEVSLTDTPANPFALVQHRHRAAPVAAYLDAIGDFNALMIKRIGVVQQMAQLLQQTCQRREPPPEPTRQRVSDVTPRAEVRHVPISTPRRPTQFSTLVEALNER